MTRTGAIASSARLTVTAAMAALLVGCGATPDLGSTPTEPSSKADTGTTAPNPQPSLSARVGDFPEFPRAALPEPVATSLQAILDDAVAHRTFSGVTAAVVVAGSGSWSGAAGVDDEGDPMTPDSRLLTASVAKTVTAAEVLRLAEEGKLGLDDPAAEQLPPELAFFDANGATIRDLLGMRSGLIDPPGDAAPVDAGANLAEALKKEPAPVFPAGSEILYANINFVLLGTIIEHVTGRPLWEALRSDVLDHPGLGGFVYPVKNALAADGGWVRSDAATLARWGYELYGGSVLSNASLREMTDFRGDWYGLGAIDFSDGTPAVSGFGVPAIGHGGLEPSTAVMLVAFPETDVVVAVQAHAGDLPEVATVVGSLRDAAQPGA